MTKPKLANRARTPKPCEFINFSNDVLVLVSS
jgi:hypothetical protein